MSSASSKAGDPEVGEQLSETYSPAPGKGERRLKTTSDGLPLVPQPSDDPRDPLNWPMAKKVAVFSAILFATFTGIAASAANLLSTPQQAKDWQVTGEQAAYSVSGVISGIILGPVLLVPLVRIFGVMSCCFWSAIIVAVTSIWAALSTGPAGYSSFIASRTVGGLFTATSQVFITGVIYNVFFLHQRGRALGIYSMVHTIAQVAGPTFGGYIVNFTAWPVCYWWTVGANFLAAVLIFLFGEEILWDRIHDRPVASKPLPESYLARRVALFLPGTAVGIPHAGRDSLKSLKATVLIGLSPVTVLIGVYSLVSFSWLIMAGVQIPLILEPPAVAGGFGFSPLGVANFYFAAWIGSLLAVLYAVLVNDRLPIALQRRNGGVWKVEYRLYTAWLPGLVVGPVGLGVFGAAVFYHWHWAAMAVGGAMLTFAAVASVPASINYLIEMWKLYPQEVGAALNVWRNVLSIAVQFFYAPWVAAVGANWVWGTAAFCSLVGFACLVLLMWKGPALRRFELWPSTDNDEVSSENEKIQ